MEGLIKKAPPVSDTVKQFTPNSRGKTIGRSCPQKEKPQKKETGVDERGEIG